MNSREKRKQEAQQHNDAIDYERWLKKTPYIQELNQLTSGESMDTARREAKDCQEVARLFLLVITHYQLEC